MFFDLQSLQACNLLFNSLIKDYTVKHGYSLLYELVCVCLRIIQQLPAGT